MAAAWGAPIVSADLRGKWTLISFVEPGCEPCDQELRDLGARHSAWKPRLNLLVVLIGRPVFASAESAARRFAQRLNLPMAVAVDPHRKITNQYCDRPVVTPFSVLLDKHGIVRFVQAGRRQTTCALVPKFSLRDDIDALLAGEPLGFTPVVDERLTYGRRAPDGAVLIQEQHIRLSGLWRRRPVLLTFVSKDCPTCPRRLASLERVLGNSDSITPVYVYPNRREAEAGRALRTRGLIGADASKGVLRGAYQAWNERVPFTYLIVDGRLVYAPGERANPEELLRLLRTEGRKTR